MDEDQGGATVIDLAFYREVAAAMRGEAPTRHRNEPPARRADAAELAAAPTGDLPRAE